VIQTAGARARAASRRPPGCSWPPAAARNPGPRLDHLEDLPAAGEGGSRGIGRLNGQADASVAKWLSVTPRGTRNPQDHTGIVAEIGSQTPASRSAIDGPPIEKASKAARRSSRLLYNILIDLVFPEAGLSQRSRPLKHRFVRPPVISAVQRRKKKPRESVQSGRVNPTFTTKLPVSPMSQKVIVNIGLVGHLHCNRIRLCYVYGSVLEGFRQCVLSLDWH
jgi:hypothetical protein